MIVHPKALTAVVGAAAVIVDAATGWTSTSTMLVAFFSSLAGGGVLYLALAERLRSKFVGREVDAERASHMSARLDAIERDVSNLEDRLERKVDDIYSAVNELRKGVARIEGAASNKEGVDNP